MGRGNDGKQGLIEGYSSRIWVGRGNDGKQGWLHGYLSRWRVGMGNNYKMVDQILGQG